MRLNMGSGDKIREGYINVDNNEDFHPDMLMNIFEFPLPIEDNLVDDLLLDHVLEHCPKGKIEEFFDELYRVCQDKAIIHISVPHLSSSGAFAAPAHNYYFNSDSLGFIDYRIKNYEGLKTKGKFEVIKTELVMSTDHWKFLNIFNPFINRFKWFAENFFCKWLPIKEVKYEVLVIK